MFFISSFKEILEALALLVCIITLTGAVVLTFKTRFIQFRTIPTMLKLLFGNIFKKKKTHGNNEETIAAHKALFTAMSTSIGIGNIVAPIIAIKLGGPGALLGFILVTLFGSAAMFTEVTFALKYRKKNSDGTISGGPMQYLKKVLSPVWALIYAHAGLILLAIWSSNQANQLAELLQPRGVPTYLTGILLAITIMYILLGGIKRIGDLSAKLVPIMFTLYCGATLWIILNNISKLPAVLNLIFRSAFTPQSIIGAGAGYGIQMALRWGLAKGFFAMEAGLGVATIPHSMANTKSPLNQGILSMVSIYSNGILCLLSGLTILLTDTWLDPSLGISINILTKTFSIYFSSIGIVILMFSAFLFAFGTIVGNSYIGGQCFLYASKNRWLITYYAIVAVFVFVGAIIDVKLLATITDFFLIPIAIPNIIGIVILAFKEKNVLKIDKEY
jgi:alanine or glycine:cation symporter, AGCS family